jgi:hypothetical protein
MKILTLFIVATRLATGLSLGRDERPGENSKPPALRADNVAGPKLVTSAPAGCRKLSTDSDWPTAEQWKAALPEVVPFKNRGTGFHPDYTLRARSAKDVQQAVTFCKQNNIRLTIINSGHDWLGRNDAPSGLSLDVSLLTGARVLSEFNATLAGAEKPLLSVNTITPVPGKQAAVTFGVGLSTQKLHNAVSLSKLVTVGAR